MRRLLLALRRSKISVVAMMLGLAAPALASDGLTVERVVMVMRHGVRPPTKEPALPPEIAPDPWPSWSVPPGWLTPHGAEAIRLLGKDDHAVFAADGLLPAAGCPVEGTVAVSSDSDERTIATGDAWLQGLAPGCAIANRHLAQGAPDPMFHDPAVATLDPAEADRAVSDALGPSGIAGAERDEKPALQALDRILCGDRAGGCGVSATPSTITSAKAGKSPKMSGALELGSSAAQSILLEYADGKPMPDVGWGRATPGDIALIGALHSESFVIHARPRILAAANAAGIARAIVAALEGGSAKVTVIVGHDTNVANLAGLLNLHWHISGFAADDPAPGGALIFELLHDPAAHRFVRVFYRSQSLEQMRALRPEKPEHQMLPVTPCQTEGICPLRTFETIISK